MSQQAAIDQLSLSTLVPARSLSVLQGQGPGRGIAESGALSN